MRSSLAIAALASASCVSAIPIVGKRNNGGGSSGINDYVILQYALTLEHLEDTFYREGLSRFSDSDFQAAGFDSSVRSRISEVSKHESSHVAFLSGALTSLGQSPVAACKYNFGITDVQSFLATSAVVEGVGVSAYLGAAAFIMDKAYLTAAATILTVEARHTSYVRNTIGEDPFPAAYDIPLTFNEVYSLVTPFFVSCPESNVALPVKAFPALTATVVGDAKPNGMVKVVPADMNSVQGKTVYAAFIGFPTTEFGVWNHETMTVTIPANAAGQTYIVLTTSNKAVTDDNTLAGPAIIEIPTQY